MFRARVVLIATTILLAGVPGRANSPTSSITGAVRNAADEPLPGASVVLQGSRVTTTTDIRGEYRLAPVPVGEATVTVDYVGFDTQTVAVTVEPGKTASRDFVLHPAERFFGTVEVIGEPLLQGQAKALNQQKNAPNVQNVVAREQMEQFPDKNVAEVTQRVAGIAIERDQGEGRYVLIRGTEPRLNSMMINGERIPAPEDDYRQVAMDVIPSEMLESIEVSKALTPDMDGDAIGGAVNLVLRQPPSEGLISASIGGGYNDLGEGSSTTAAFMIGDRFADDTFGMVLGGSWFDTDRVTENFEVSYDDLDLGELEYRDYTLNRERLGFTFQADYQPDFANRWDFQSTWNQFEDLEYRRRVTNVVEDGEIERELKDRFESQEIFVVAGSGEHTFSNTHTLRYKLQYSSAKEDEPDSVYSNFIQEDVEFDPNVSEGFIDPDNIQANPLNEDYNEFWFDELSHESSLSEESDLVASVDYGIPYAWSGGTAGMWKLGVKYRDKSKDVNKEIFVYESDDHLNLQSFLDSGYTKPAILDGRYPMGPFQSYGAMRALLGSGTLEGEKDYEEDAADYSADETTYAAYVATEMYLSDRLMLLPGVRYERTENDYTGYEVLFDDEGDWAETTPLNGSKTYDVVLPHFHVRYRLDDRSNLRFAATRSFARPNFYDLAPYELILEEDSEINRGNPDLDPTMSWNGDVMYERFLGSVGLLSGGVFYKDLTDFIFPFRSEEIIDGEEYEIFQPRNGDDASLYGLELAYVNRFASLPGLLSGFGLYANYTYIDSEASFPEREDTTVPGQSEHVGNLGLTYERGGFSGSITYTYRGEYLSEVGDEAAEDLYVDDHGQLDANFSYRFRMGLRLYLQLNNLTDEPFRVYLATPDRPVQEEYYSWWGILGVRYDF